jgi:uncharacterized protein (TIGR03437 family)
MGTTVGGTMVYVNGVTAPLLYAGATQVSVIVPFATSGKTAQIYVSYQGQISNAVSAAIAPAAPGLFTLDFSGKGQAAAVNNQDGSINGPASPAKAGTYVSLYLTGGGQTIPASSDGAQATDTAWAALPVSVTIGGKTVPVVQYAGAAPTAVAGVMQVNAQVPTGLTAGAVPVVVSVGGVPSQPGVTITVN